MVSVAYGVSLSIRASTPPGSPAPGASRDLTTSGSSPFLLALATRARERLDGVDEVAVGPHLLDHRIRYGDPELGLERHRQIDQVERIGGQIVRQRHARREPVGTGPEAIGNHTPHPGLDR